jgi:integrase
MKLKNSTIDRIELPIGKMPGKKGDRILWDDDLPGFGVRIREGGSRNYIIQYKIGAQQRRKSLGSTKELTLEQARKLAKKDLGRVANGEDPQGEKAAARATAAETFGAIAERFIAYQGNHLRPSSLASTRLYLTKYFKRVHALKIEAVTKREIVSVLETVNDKSGPVAADRAGSAVSALFAWAAKAGLVKDHPAKDLNKYAGVTSRDRVLDDKEIAAIWLAAGDDSYGRIIKLLILTGQRRDEIAGLNRDEIIGQTIELPAKRTKNGRPHVVPLSDAAYALIEDLLVDDKGPFLFGRNRAGAFSGFSKAKTELDAKLPGIEPWRVHDIRRSVATGMAELGVEPHHVEAVLNHVSGHRSGVAGVYNRAAYLEPKTTALNLWANHIAVIVAQASGTNVTTLRNSSRQLAPRGKSA